MINVPAEEKNTNPVEETKQEEKGYIARRKVLVVIPFDDETSLIHDANDSIYGLAAGIWTQDYTRAFKLADTLDVGTVWINTYKVFSISTPFGGFKDSGLGREKGLESLKAYMQQKSIFLALNPQPNRWCE